MADKRFGQHLQELRKSCNYTQEFVASYLDISRQAYSHYETGRAVPPNDTCYKIAKLYGIPTDKLIELSLQICDHSLTSPNSKESDDLNAFLSYIEQEEHIQKLKHLNRKEKELLYYFDCIPEEEQNEILEILKIKKRKTENKER